MPVHLEGHDTTWRPDPGAQAIVTVNWVVCRDCGQMWSVEPDDFELGDAFWVLPDDEAWTSG
jgi:hypothetical protein